MALHIAHLLSVFQRLHYPRQYNSYFTGFWQWSLGVSLSSWGVLLHCARMNQNSPKMEAQHGHTQMIQARNTLPQASQLYSCAHFLLRSRLIPWGLWMHILFPKMKHLEIGLGDLLRSLPIPNVLRFCDFHIPMLQNIFGKWIVFLSS